MKKETMQSEALFHPSSFILHPSRRAFTLVEMLVVIGVMVLLISILVPLVMRSARQAGMLRAQADLQAITTAIEAYKQDHGDIPRIPIAPAGSTYPLAGLPYPNLGAAQLGKALMGSYGDGLRPDGTTDISDPPQYQATVAYIPGDVFRDSGDPLKMYVTLVPTKEGTAVAAAPENFARFDPNDGADGPGFRKRLGSAGPISSPYMVPGKIAFHGAYFLDHYGNQILYFPASTRKRQLSTQATVPARQPYVDISPATPTDMPPLFDAKDNMEAFARRDGDGKRLISETDAILLMRIRVMMGDFDASGHINTPDPMIGVESPITKQYILWSAGPDGLFGPTGIFFPASGNPTAAQAVEYQRAVGKTDDVVNFK